MPSRRENAGSRPPAPGEDPDRKLEIARRLRSVGLKATPQRILILQELPIAHRNRETPFGVQVDCSLTEVHSRPTYGHFLPHIPTKMHVIGNTNDCQGRQQLMCA